MEQAVEGSLRRVFPTTLQPVQLAKAAARAMEEAQVVGLLGAEVPNVYRLRLAPDDLARFSEYTATLSRELSRYLVDYARERRLRPVGEPQVELTVDPKAARRERARRGALRRRRAQASSRAGAGRRRHAPAAPGGARGRGTERRRRGGGGRRRVAERQARRALSTRARSGHRAHRARGRQRSGDRQPARLALPRPPAAGRVNVAGVRPGQHQRNVCRRRARGWRAATAAAALGPRCGWGTTTCTCRTNPAEAGAPWIFWIWRFWRCALRSSWCCMCFWRWWCAAPCARFERALTPPCPEGGQRAAVGGAGGGRHESQSRAGGRAPRWRDVGTQRHG